MFLILCGKSASGKDTIAKRLSRRGFTPIVSCTSRPMREGETNAEDYWFYPKEVFEKLIEEDMVIEYRSYKTLVNGKEDIWYYGTLKNDYNPNKDYVIVLDLDGAKAFRDYYGWENCLCVLLDASSADRTKRAMRRGSFDKTEWERRLEADDEAFTDEKCEKVCDLVIHNGEMDFVSNAVGQIVSWFEHKFYD